MEGGKGGGEWMERGRGLAGREEGEPWKVCIDPGRSKEGGGWGNRGWWEHNRCQVTPLFVLVI